ncbi:sn-glycerol-3-phosphate ABC transporter ATP-binding protein UgpC [Pelagibius litoralis]|uniref:Sn-glycerol-3-phosphate ABC transporter ATP-binding protein UgpC n=1 Tax=Pelagibius litoralis TaxID=374515 RepID=A0A967EX50_9PROT|nr:sn-glycerol-3-phosphate ABC transporter ATP-binding protein UgpC [Pelagibius litoralis]NIA67715.1 sn-glycerol-3-phosphate ABC transporter ATP-binding protein UgpC [Pelagibius litoralis]
MASVEYVNVGKSFGAVKVMEDISFTISDQKFVVLLGPSGCGKTTLLRMTAGLETIADGEIHIGGKRMNNVHPRDRDIAMVFQNYALYPTLKVFDNIAFSLQVRRQSKDEVKKQVEWAAELLNLTPYLARYPKELSGGQRQRVAMGRALVRHPQVFLFDEPLSNLDAKLRGQMRYEIRRLHDRLQTTTIYVTHDQIEAMTMADEIVVMRDGEIEQIGTPEEIYDRPANCFVADFIGSPSINFLKGEIQGTAGQQTFHAGGMVLPLPAQTKAEPGQKVTCGIRPVDIAVGPDGPVKAEVVLVESTGAESHLLLTIDGQEIRAVAQGRLRARPGDICGLSIDPATLHLFDAGSEQRIN